jgi:hypothetical protein
MISYSGGEQVNGNSKKLKKMLFMLATLKELQLSTLDVLFAFVYNL